MFDFGSVTPPPIGRPVSVSISPGSWEATAMDLFRLAFNTSASAVWPTANLSILWPFSVSQPCTILRFWSQNGATASGNLDMGIYNDAGTLIGSIGSTAQSGTSNVQWVTPTPINLSPNVRYYFAIAMDGTTGTVFRTTAAISVGQVQAAGIVQVAANFPLATGVTFAAPANNYVPMAGMSRLTV